MTEFLFPHDIKHGIQLRKNNPNVVFDAEFYRIYMDNGADMQLKDLKLLFDWAIEDKINFDEFVSKKVLGGPYGPWSRYTRLYNKGGKATEWCKELEDVTNHIEKILI